MTEQTLPPVANMQIDAATPAFAGASIPALGSAAARATTTPGGDAEARLPASLYRSIAWPYWLAAAIVGGLAWLAFFQLFHTASGHP